MPSLEADESESFELLVLFESPAENAAKKETNYFRNLNLIYSNFLFAFDFYNYHNVYLG